MGQKGPVGYDKLFPDVSFDSPCDQELASKTPSAETGAEGLGLSHRVVMSLLECIANPSHHEVFFDNFLRRMICLWHFKI